MSALVATRRRSFKRAFREIDDEQLEYAAQIDVTSSPVAKAKEDKYESDASLLIQDSSPFKSTPQDQLACLIEDSAPVQEGHLQRYEQDPVIEVPSPIKLEAGDVDVPESKDSREFQVRREKLSLLPARLRGFVHLADDPEVRSGSRKPARGCHKRLVSRRLAQAATSQENSDSGSSRMTAALLKYLSGSEKERNAFFREADYVDKDSHQSVDVEVQGRQFAVFGKCIVHGRILCVRGFSEEQTFEMEDQEIRLMIDDVLGHKFGARLDPGRCIRIFHPFTLIRAQHSDFILQDFFFMKSLNVATRQQPLPQVTFLWTCPCRVTDMRVHTIDSADCEPNCSQVRSQY